MGGQSSLLVVVAQSDQQQTTYQNISLYALISSLKLEKLCYLKLMYGTTKGKNVLHIFTKNFEERGFDIKKIFSVATDSAPPMMGQHRGFATLIEQKIGHPVIKLHCISHQEIICGKISNSAFNDVMSTVTKIVSLLAACSSTTHKKFRSLLGEMESTYQDVLLH